VHSTTDKETTEARGRNFIVLPTFSMGNL